MFQFIIKKLKLSPFAERLLFDFSLLVFTFSLILAILVLYWIFQPTKILTIYNEPIPTLGDGAKPGDTVVFIINYCKSDATRGKVQWEMVGNSSVTILPPYIDATAKSCNTRLLDPVIVPPQLKPGMYYVVWQITYPVNPLKYEYIEFRSRDFTINK